MSKISNEQKLKDAFERLKAGKPERISAKRKVSPTAVEDEAGLGRSLLRNNSDYNDLFRAIVDYKTSASRKQQSDDTAVSGTNEEHLKKKLSSIDPEVAKLNKLVKQKNTEIQECKEKIAFLTAANAELTAMVCERVVSDQWQDFLRIQEQGAVVPFKK